MAAFVDCPILPQGSPFLAEAVLVHDVPGRLRLVAPALRNKPDGIAMLRTRLGQLDAVRAIHFNTLSSSVIVEYVTRTGSREACSERWSKPVAGCEGREHARPPAPRSSRPRGQR